MRRQRRSILFIDSFTTLDGPASDPSSDAVGYGITAASAIRRGLASRGYNVIRPTLRVRKGASAAEFRPAWIVANYDGILTALTADAPDLIMCFHSFGVFPAEIRRICLDLQVFIPIIGYTHGSHWDPSDRFRTDYYPGMHLVDLANLHVMDSILLGSEYMKDVLLDQIGSFNKQLTDELANRMAVVGLPIDVTLIDSCRTGERFDRVTIVYNHAPIRSKNPGLFLDAIADVLLEHDVNVLLTRRFPISSALNALADRFGDRVILGDDLALDEYYRNLWMSDIQVSTASHESLGISTIEAMYTKNYCIVPRTGSYPEILGETYEGMYDGSKTELLERLRYALKNPRERTAAAGKLPQLARRYSPDLVNDKLVAVIERVLESSRDIDPSNRGGEPAT